MSRVPRLSPGVDIKSLPLKPAEAFLLSRVDGIVDERELGLITGMTAQFVDSALSRLIELGAIRVDPPSRVQQSTPHGPRPPPPPTSPTSGKTSSAPPQSHSYGRSADSGSSPPLYDPAELDEGVELDQDRKRKILDLFYRLDDYNYYELLGVSEQADKKQIKSAYYVIAPEFHPDKFFRKNLGSFKPKIEAVFARCTLAHDILTSKEKRPEYDAYLEQTHRNRAMSALLDQSQRDIAAVVSAVEESAKAIIATGPVNTAAPAPTPGRYVEREPQRPESVESRRGTFARKLAGGAIRGSVHSGRPSAAPPVVSSVPPATPAPSVAPHSSPAAAGAALMARYEAARAEASRQQLGRYVENARSALDRKDYAAAANAYRIAASLAPNDAGVQKAAADAAKLAATALAEGFLKQGQYEAQNGRWAEAALSYTKVCAGRPDDAKAHERVAFATIESGGSARRAVEFARRAVELAPTVPDMHLTLARAFFAAGLDKSAKAEIERALQLAPKDARVKELALGMKERPKDGKVG